MPAPAFKYRKRTSEDVEKRASQQSGSFIGALQDWVKVYKPRDGENWVRFMPPTWDNPHHYGIDVWIHDYFGPQNATAICLTKMAAQAWLMPQGYDGHSCALDEAAREAEYNGDEEEAKELKARKKVLVWLIDRKDESAGVQAWLMPWKLDKDVAANSRDRRSGELYLIDHPDDGYDVFFDKTGSKLNTAYTGVGLDRSPSQVPNKFLDYITEHPLPSALLWRPNAELKALYGGDASPEEHSGSARGSESRRRPADEQDEAPQRSTRRRVEEEEPSGRRPTGETTTTTSRSERRRVEEEPDPSESSAEPVERGTRSAGRTVSNVEPISRPSSRRVVEEESEPEPQEERSTSRPSIRSESSAERADTPSASAGAGRRPSPRPEPKEQGPASNGGSSKSRLDALRERYAKK